MRRAISSQRLLLSLFLIIKGEKMQIERENLNVSVLQDNSELATT